MVEMVQVEIDGKIVDMEGIQKTDEKGYKKQTRRGTQRIL